MELQGRVHLIGGTETVGANGFTKRQLVIETDEQYKQTIPVDFVKDKTSVLDNYKVGDDVKVSINVRGNEYNGKYYVNLQGWRVEKLASAPAPSYSTPADAAFADEPIDDVPF